MSSLARESCIITVSHITCVSNSKLQSLFCMLSLAVLVDNLERDTKRIVFDKYLLP